MLLLHLPMLLLNLLLALVLLPLLLRPGADDGHELQLQQSFTIKSPAKLQVVLETSFLKRCVTEPA